MSECSDCGRDHPSIADMMDGESKHGMAIPINLFGGDLSQEERDAISDVMESVERSQLNMMHLGDELDEIVKPIVRIATSITDAAALPIVMLIKEGADPITAFKAVMAGVAVTMFLAGQQYEKDSHGDKRPAQPMREKLPDPTPEQAAMQKDLFARLGLQDDENDD